MAHSRMSWQLGVLLDKALSIRTHLGQDHIVSILQNASFVCRDQIIATTLFKWNSRALTSLGLLIRYWEARGTKRGCRACSVAVQLVGAWRVTDGRHHAVENLGDFLLHD